MAENIKGQNQNQNQGQRSPQADVNKKPGADKGQADTVGNRDLGDANKNRMSPDIENQQERSRQGNQGNQGNLGGQGSQSQGVSNPNKMSPDKDRVQQNVDIDNEDRATQRTQRPNLDRESQK